MDEQQQTQIVPGICIIAAALIIIFGSLVNNAFSMGKEPLKDIEYKKQLELEKEKEQLKCLQPAQQKAYWELKQIASEFDGMDVSIVCYSDKR